MARGNSRAITSNADAVTVEGLADFHRALKKLDDQYPKAVKNSNYNLANEIAKRAKTSARSQGGIVRHGSRSLRAARQASAAVVVGGGPRYPTFWGAEFGSKQYRQFKSWRGNQWGGWSGGPGYFLHPTIRRDARALIDEYMRELDALADEAFPD